MMGFDHLSQVAHRMEDFLKILRVRQDPEQINTEVETLLLQGVDTLRTIARLYRRSTKIDEAWLQKQVHPIFQQLQDRLGELREEDEDALLAQEEQVDVSMILFTGGVEDCLDTFEQQLEQLAQLNPQQLRQELQATTEQLAEFGRMGELQAFVSLCESVQEVLPRTAPSHIQPLATEVLSVWRRCHSLVLIGRTAQLPEQLVLSDSLMDHMTENAAQSFFFPSTEVGGVDLRDSADGFSSAMDLPEPDIDLDLIPDLDLSAVADLEDLQDVVADFGVDEFGVDEFDTKVAIAPGTVSEMATASAFTKPITEPTIGPHYLLNAIDSLADQNLTDGTQVNGGERQTVPSPDLSISQIGEHRNSLAETLEMGEEPSIEPPPPKKLPELSPEPPRSLGINNAIAINNAISSSALTPGSHPIAPDMSSSTVRVSVAELQKINSLFGELIVERNAVNLRVSQLKNLFQLMQRRMQQLEQSNLHLRDWYDQASLDGLVASQEPQPETVVRGNLDLNAFQSSTTLSPSSDFDALEMDQYTELHLVSQDQMETIVQLQEVAADIELNLQEMGQATEDLNYTTQALQRNITRTQMRPFSDIVSRFPRVVRDLSLQYNKQVEFKLEGENTLIDRFTLEALTDPLNHLLRNAFDHGIEEGETRRGLGKPAQGQITLRAMHRGNQTIITLQDDGQGIDGKKISDRLGQLGLTEAELATLSDQDLLQAIFEPGFSTAQAVTELSGRGMGMDVVRTNLAKIRGDIRIDTQVNRGTTFTIRIPLSLSVLRVMVVEIDRQIYALPVDSVISVVRLDGDNVVQADNQEILTWNHQQIELVRPQRWLSFNGPNRPFEMEGTPAINKPVALVINQNNRDWGLCIDQFWGEQEISLRPVNSPIPLPPGFSGSTILGDGRVIPLLDPFRFLEWIMGNPASRALSLEPQEGSIEPSPTKPEVQPILVVDDSVNVRRYLAVTLEKQGYRVEQAKDGQEAVDKLQGGLRVQAVICDIEMPRLDGYGVLSEVRSQGQFRDLPIIMLTSRSNDKHRKLAMNLGASAYFSKPYNEQELLKTLADFLVPVAV
jgi:chemosensory pili system protein ChpA (sensor histidine kinase/response regulator)